MCRGQWKGNPVLLHHPSSSKDIFSSAKATLCLYPNYHCRSRKKYWSSVASGHWILKQKGTKFFMAPECHHTIWSSLHTLFHLMFEELFWQCFILSKMWDWVVCLDFQQSCWWCLKCKHIILLLKCIQIYWIRLSYFQS